MPTMSDTRNTIAEVDDAPRIRGKVTPPRPDDTAPEADDLTMRAVGTYTPPPPTDDEEE